MSTTAISLADLRTVDLFDDLTEAELEPWVAAAYPREAQPGDALAEQGQAPAEVILLLEGTAQALLIEPDRTERVGGRHRAPTWMGAIAALTGGPLGVRMVAETPCRMALIPVEDFRRLALAHPAVHERVMQQVTPVLGRLAAIEQNRERLASLGTMAAGLAHELNNPAAAAQRAAAQMAEALEVVSSTIRRFVDAGMEREQAAELVTLHQQAIDGANSRTVLDALDAADAEDALTERLEDLGVPEPWRLAEPLASAGVDEAWLARVAELAGPATDAAVGWVAATLTARGLAKELEESTRRMSDLVTAMKSYAYVDRGELVEVDLHEGLETTLVVLRHKLKHTAIELVREYDRTLPKLTVRASELNQVWTNLLDNAIDALGDKGTITIVTRRDGPGVAVEVSDDGPGIPPELRERIFDSFFTTKDVGQGTGIGLATARRIVSDGHSGSLTVDSEPGRTTFRVWLPLTPGS
ncbi:MAG TPA: ATP-binding protein [Solirubrobacteraceae bacterium]|nr:ATP-binding protein [Solirubrobacteraceae bacterium]